MDNNEATMQETMLILRVVILGVTIVAARTASRAAGPAGSE